MLSEFEKLRNATQDLLDRINEQPVSVDYGDGVITSATDQAKASVGEMLRYLEFMCKVVVDVSPGEARPREH